MDYSEKTDEELIDICKLGEEKSNLEIINRYSKVVSIISKPYFIIGADGNDLIQEGMIGLMKAIRDYDISRGSSFNTFAKMCILRQILTAIRRENSKKYTPLNQSYSLNVINKFNEGDNKTENIDLLEEEGLTPEENVICKENIEFINRLIKTELSNLEKKVLKLYIKGENYDKIALILNKDYKSVDNTIQRLRNKLQIKLKKRI